MALAGEEHRVPRPGHLDRSPDGRTAVEDDVVVPPGDPPVGAGSDFPGDLGGVLAERVVGRDDEEVGALRRGAAHAGPVMVAARRAPENGQQPAAGQWPELGQRAAEGTGRMGEVDVEGEWLAEVHQLEPAGNAGEAGEAGGDLVDREAGCEADTGRGEGVVDVEARRQRELDRRLSVGSHEAEAADLGAAEPLGHDVGLALEGVGPSPLDRPGAEQLVAGVVAVEDCRLGDPLARPGRAEVDEPRLGGDVVVPARVVVEVVAADIGDGHDVEVAGAHPLLDEGVGGHLENDLLDLLGGHPGEPGLEVGSFDRGLARFVVVGGSTDVERDRAHRAGPDPGRLEDVGCHVGRRRLAVGAGNAGDPELAGGPTQEDRRQLGQRRAGGGHDDDRGSGRKRDPALERDGGSSSSGVGGERVAVDGEPGHRDEEVARSRSPGVLEDLDDLCLRARLDPCARNALGQLGEPHPGQHNRRVATTLGGREFDWGSRVYLMGIVNVTPDSFSGDGVTDPVAAVEQGLQMVAEGADMLDVGGESTRPGHQPVTAEVELERVLPVVDRLAREAGVPVSIDTWKLPVAKAAVAAGATIVNDVWGLQRSPGLAELAAREGLGLIVMHNQEGTAYTDLMGELLASLRRSMAVAEAAGVPPDRVIVDPGIGFGKTAEQNLVVLRRLAELGSLDRPLLVGTSRKSFIGKILDLPVDDRLEGTAASVAAAILRGADIVRVHDVRAMTRVVRVAEALR